MNDVKQKLLYRVVLHYDYIDLVSVICFRRHFYLINMYEIIVVFLVNFAFNNKI